MMSRCTQQRVHCVHYLWVSRSGNMKRLPQLRCVWMMSPCIQLSSSTLPQSPQIWQHEEIATTPVLLHDATLYTVFIEYITSVSADLATWRDCHNSSTSSLCHTVHSCHWVHYLRVCRSGTMKRLPQLGYLCMMSHCTHHWGHCVHYLRVSRSGNMMRLPQLRYLCMMTLCTQLSLSTLPQSLQIWQHDDIATTAVLLHDVPLYTAVGSLCTLPQGLQIRQHNEIATTPVLLQDVPLYTVVIEYITSESPDQATWCDCHNSGTSAWCPTVHSTGVIVYTTSESPDLATWWDCHNCDTSAWCPIVHSSRVIEYINSESLNQATWWDCRNSSTSAIMSDCTQFSSSTLPQSLQIWQHEEIATTLVLLYDVPLYTVFIEYITSESADLATWRDCHNSGTSSWCPAFSVLATLSPLGWSTVNLQNQISLIKGIVSRETCINWDHRCLV
jgi:hypothetical protein